MWWYQVEISWYLLKYRFRFGSQNIVFLLSERQRPQQRVCSSWFSSSRSETSQLQLHLLKLTSNLLATLYWPCFFTLLTSRWCNLSCWVWAAAVSTQGLCREPMRSRRRMVQRSSLASSSWRVRLESQRDISCVRFPPPPDWPTPFTSQVKSLQLERDQAQMLLENIQQRHKQDLELIENMHK